MKHLFLMLVLGVVAFAPASGQCPPTGFPDAGDNCPSAPILCVTLDGYCNTINNNNTPQTFPGCGPPWQLNNDEWFAFYAGSTTITIEVVPNGCSNNTGMQGLQGGIYYGCGGPVMDVQCACTTNPFILTSNSFIVGEIYWMVLDGCDGNVCDYTINVLSGSTAGGPPADPGPITGPIQVCQGDTEAYSMLPVDAATIYNWNMTPNLGGISDNDNNANISWNTPGTAQLCVDVANACYSNPNVSCLTIEVLPIPTATLSGSGSFCKEGALTPVDLTVTFTGTGPWEFVYTVDGMPQPPVTTSDNPYTLAISSSGTVALSSLMSTTGSCVGTVSGNVTITETAISPTATATDPLCAGDGTGSISVSVSGGASPYSYQWTPGGIGQNPTGLPAGTYTVTVTDDDGCTGEATVTLADPPLLVASGTSTQGVDCNNPTGSISTTVTGGTGGYTYQWSPSGSGPNPSGLPDGTYLATVTDANGCTDTLSATIAIDTISPVAAASTPGMLDCAQTTLIISGSGSDTGPNVTYQWTGPGIVSGGTTLNPTINQPGSYTITVTNTVNGCSETATVVVGQDITQPVAMATAPPITCDNQSVNIDASGTDTGPNFTYQWTGPGIVSGGTTLNPVVNQSGTYTLTVTNTANGCETTISVSVPEDLTPPPAQANAPPITCDDPTVTINGNGSATGPDISYQWTGPGIVSGGTTLNPVVDQPGTYTLTVTNAANGCEGMVTVTVPEQTQLPAAVATASPITCANPTITISGNGSSTGPGFTYQWTTVDGNIVSGGTTLNPTVDQAGTYTLTVVNTQTGCENMVSVTVGEDLTPPLAEAGPTFELTCETTTVQLNGAGSDSGANFTYQWTGPGIVSGGTTLTPTVNQPGTYTITVTNTQNGCETTDQVTVTQDITPPLAAGSAPPITCVVTSVTIDGSGSSTGPDFQYQWMGPGVVSGGTTLNPLVNQPGTYTLTVTNTGNGCTQTASVTVADQTQLPNAVASADPLTCTQNSVLISGAGTSTGSQYTYQWSTANGNIVSGSTQLNPVVDEVGTYTLTVLNNNTGCQNMVSVQVGIDTIPPVAEAGPALALDCGNPTIQLNGNGSSTGAGMTYSWSGPGLVAGGFGLTPTINLPGTYTLVVTNGQNGCQASDQVVVTADYIPPVIDILPAELITCLTTQIQLDATNSSTGPNFFYQWNTTGGIILNGANTATPTVGSGGVYTLTLTNTQNQCFSVLGVVVPEDTAPPVADAGPDLEITCAVQELPLFGFGSSQGPNYTYLWTTPDGNIVSGSTALNPLVNEPGTYTLMVTNNSNGCVSTSDAVVGVDSNVPVANAGPNQTITCINSTVTLNGTGSSSGPGFSYSWSTSDGNIVSGANSLIPTVNQAGLYQLTVVNTSNGCVANSFATVAVDIVLPVAVIAPAQEVNCNNPQVTLDATGSSSNGNFSYIWNTANGNIVSGQGTLTPVVDQGGNYVLTIINNQTGCMNGANVMVAENIDNPILSIASPGLISCTEPQLTLDATGSSTGPEFQYAWTTIDGNIVSGGDTPTPLISSGGTYELTILNVNTNCSSSGMVTVPENADLPSVDLDPAEELNCTLTQQQLNAVIGGGGNLSFNWTTPDGNFVSGTNTLQPLVDAPGAYQLQVVNDDTGCQNTASVNVAQDVQIPTADAGSDDLLTCVTTSLSLDGSGSETGAGISYQWTTSDGNIVSGGTGMSPLVDAPGLYVLQVLNTANTCTSADTVLVVEDVATPSASILPPVLMGCADPIVTIDASASSGGPDLVYSWITADGNILSGADGLLLEVDAPGTYALQVLDTLNGCFSTAQTTVVQDTDLPLVDTGLGGELNCTVTSIQLQADASGQVANFTYTWTTMNGNIVSGQGTLTPVVDQAGTYTLTVLDTINQCSTASSVEITQDADLPVAVIEPSNTLNCNFTTAVLDASASTQGPDLVYTWTTVGGNFVGDPSGLMPTIDQAGSYTLTINDTINSCITSETIQMMPDTLSPILSLTTPGTLNCFQPDLELQVTAGGATDMSVLWTTVDGNIVANADSLNPTVDLPGVYELFVQNNANGCSSNLEATVAADFALPAVNAGPDGTIDCVATELSLQGSADAGGAPITFIWSTPDGNILSGADGPTPLVDAGGTYTLAVTNEENGCSNSAEVLVAQDQNLPTADAGQPGLLNCYDPVIILDGTASSSGPGLLYEWTTSDGSILSGANTLQPEVDAPGTYLLTVTDQGNGCVSSTNVLVAEDFQQPAADAGPGQELTCSITSLNLSGAGSTGAEFQYSWTTPDGNILSGADGPNPLIDAAGTYTLEVQNVDNGCSTTASTTVTDAVAFPLAVASLDGILTCAVQTLGLDGAGSDAGPNFTYQWSTIGGNILSGGNTLTPTVDLPGLYTLSVTDTSNDCVSTAEVQVPIDTLSPLAEAGPAGLLTCTVQALDLDAAGSSIGANFSYVWSTADGNILNGANTLNPAVDEPGTYQILVSNLDNGCTAVDQVAVGEDVTPPDAGSSVSGILTCAQTSLSLSGSGSSTGPNFGYQWTTADGNILSGAAGLSPVVDQPGTYQLTVLDQFNGCEANTAVVVQQDIVDPTVGVDMAGTLTCAITELSLQGQASGNNQPLTFQWSTADGSIQSGATSLSPLIDEPGTYELLVTDEVNGCTATAQVQVGQDVTPPNVAIVGPGELNCLQETVTIDATASSSGPDFQSNWTTTGGNILSGNGSLQIVVDQPGSYSLLIVNLINGCSSQTETAVMQDIEMPVVDAGDGFTLPCFEQTSELSGTASASSNNLAIEWQTADGQIEANANSLSPSVSSGGLYTLLVINLDNGCSATDAVEVVEDQPEDPDVSAEQPLCSYDLGSLTVTNVVGGASPYLYSIDGGATFTSGSVFSNLGEGWYEVVVQDALGCESDEQTVFIDVPDPLVLSLETGVTILQGQSYQLEVQLNVSEDLVQQVIWTPATGLSCADCLDPVASPLTNTTYQVEVILEGECRSVEEVEVTVDKRPAIYAPNIFSPNGDGENDIFLLFARPESVQEIRTFLVFSRWGETVYSYSHFQPNDPAYGWDGNYRGQAMNPAVFAWFAEVEMLDGRIEFFEGDVTLVR